MENLIAKLSEQKGITLRQNAPMREYTTFQIGGPARLLIEPESVDALVSCYRILTENAVVPLVIGAGSNLLVSDKGIPGVVRSAEKKRNDKEVWL